MRSFKTTLRYLYRLYRWPVLSLVVFFGLSVLIGLVLPSSAKLLLLNAVLQKFTGIINQSPTNWQLALNIFTNNLTVGVLLFGLGFTLLLPVFIMIGNGVIIGVFINIMYRADTLVPGTFVSALVSLIPHGIFELSAFFLAGTLSMIVMLKVIWPKQIELTKSRRKVLLESVLRFCTVILPLLVIAALVETYVSPVVGDQLEQWLAHKFNNTTLAISPKPDWLQTYHCTAITMKTTGTNQPSNRTNSLSVLSKIIYDSKIYAQLNARRDIPMWQQNYRCDGGAELAIKGWPSLQWSVQQETNLEILVLQALGKKFTRLQLATNIERFKLSDSPDSEIIIMQHDNVTVVISTTDVLLTQNLNLQ